MNKCDKCERLGKYLVSGSNLNSYATSLLCAQHASILCANLGDKAGADKFAQLMAGEVSA
jgi:hypothetical protein